MPNTPVPAVGGATPAAKFNRSQVMRGAWKCYREIYEIFGKGRFDRNGFRWALQTAWMEAKKTARIAAIPANMKQARAETIHQQIDGLKYKSFQINTTPIRQRLEAELSALAA